MNTPFTLVYYLIFIILLDTGFCYRCTFATASAVQMLRQPGTSAPWHFGSPGKFKSEKRELK